MCHSRAISICGYTTDSLKTLNNPSDVDVLAVGYDDGTCQKKTPHRVSSLISSLKKSAGKTPVATYGTSTSGAHDSSRRPLVQLAKVSGTLKTHKRPKKSPPKKHARSPLKYGPHQVLQNPVRRRLRRKRRCLYSSCTSPEARPQHLTRCTQADVVRCVTWSGACATFARENERLSRGT